MAHSDLPADEIRRALRDDQAHHDAALAATGDVIDRVTDGGAGPDEKSRLLLGWDRRHLLRIGGAAVAASAVLAACGDGDDDGSGSTTSVAPGTTAAAPATTAASTSATPPTGATAGSAAGSAAGPTAAPTATTAAPSAGAGGDFVPSKQNDLVLLRTASSLEVLAVAAYQIAIDSGLVTDAAVGAAATLFQAQHREHAALFQAATTAAGGTAYTQPNAVILAALQPRIDGLRDEQGVIRLAYDLEVAAAQTYQFAVAKVTDPKLNTALMSVGGVEARHAAILGGVLVTLIPPAAFQRLDQAAPPESFVAV